MGCYQFESLVLWPVEILFEYELSVKYRNMGGEVDYWPDIYEVQYGSKTILGDCSWVKAETLQATGKMSSDQDNNDGDYYQGGRAYDGIAGEGALPG